MKSSLACRTGSSRTGSLYILLLGCLFLASGIYIWLHSAVYHSSILEIQYQEHLDTVFIVLGLIAVVASYLVQRRAREMGESEERFKILLESIPIGITITTPDGNMIEANSALVELSGYDSMEELLSRPVPDHYPDPSDREKFVNLVRKGSVDGFETRLRRKDGTVFSALLTAVTKNTSSGPQLITAVQDITERKEMEEELLRTRRLESIGTLAAGVAHEINNPINSIINYAQMLLDKKTIGEEERALSDRIIKEGDRISSIVKGLLSFAREEKAGKSMADVRELLFDTMVLVVAQMEKDGVNIEVDIPQTLPSIVAHYQQIQQVFLNIITNAWHALNERHPEANANKTLKIIGEETMDNGAPFIGISFIDQGTGITADTLDKIMNPFFTTKPSGMGLGMSISHGIITDHGGRLTIESRKGDYTKIMVYLPLFKNSQGG
jgi:PAS domain S-box-containing protein